MPLNYSKWDNLELSDDSDVEVHPNVDKRSFIRWKQRDIHEKRALHKAQYDALRAEHQTSQELLPVLRELGAQTHTEGHAYFARRVAQLAAARDERARRGEVDNDHPTNDDMILSLLLQIEAADTVKGKQGPELDAALVDSLTYHRDRLAARDDEVLREIAAMEEEDKKKITSESIHDGWNTGFVSKADDEADAATGAGSAGTGAPPAPPVESSTAATAPTPSRTTAIETLNSPGAPASGTGVGGSVPTGKGRGDAAAPAPVPKGEQLDQDTIHEATPEMIEFAQLPSSIPASLSLTAASLPAAFAPKTLNLNAFEQAYEFLRAHPRLVKAESSRAVDSLLLTAFEAQQGGKDVLARKAVEKALLLQYCTKLGPDGVRLFFQRMTQTHGQAALVFLNDVLSTYVRIRGRVEVLAQEAAAAGGGEEGEEQIQLVAEDPSTTIGFSIPEGPPPEQIQLQGEGLEGVTPEMVRDMLQRQWDIFSAFPPGFQEALKSQDLSQVNVLLGQMPMAEAEQVVQQLDEGGILNFSSTEIRDETSH